MTFRECRNLPDIKQFLLLFRYNYGHYIRRQEKKSQKES
jgi:hypothetical protein